MSGNGHHGEGNGSATPATRYPVVSVGSGKEEAAERRRAFPYRFPRDPRIMGGKFTVKDNADRLMRYFYFERRLAHAIGAWALAIPEFEVKLESGRHIFYHMDAARSLRERLTEQESNTKLIDGYRDADVDLFIEELLSAADPAELLVGLHQVAGSALQLTYKHHIDTTCKVTDAPTIRLLKRILTDYEPMLEWAEAAINAYADGGVDEPRLRAWNWHLQQLLKSIGGVSGKDERCAPPNGIRCKVKPFERCTVPMRDSRFVTFKNTGDYDVADGVPRYPKDSYENLRLRFIRTLRDEVDAIEAFGTFLWDIRFLDFKAEYDLARVTWDEARHTEIGYRAMQTSGYDPYELANRLTGSTCRGPMEPAYAMAEINLFGEVGVLKTINQLVDKAVEENDTLLAHISDYIRSDERTHVKKGQHILRVMTDLKMQDLEERTRELFTECMVNLGIVNKDMDLFIVSREDIEHLIGE